MPHQPAITVNKPVLALFVTGVGVITPCSVTHDESPIIVRLEQLSGRFLLVLVRWLGVQPFHRKPVLFGSNAILKSTLCLERLSHPQLDISLTTIVYSAECEDLDVDCNLCIAGQELALDHGVISLAAPEDAVVKPPRRFVEFKDGACDRIVLLTTL